MFELEESVTGAANIKVVGIGGAGGNVVNNMIACNIKAVEFIAINTDQQVLSASMAGRRVQIGTTLTRGLGAGSKPEVGREAALEDKQQIIECLEGADMVFITAGMGGGTGTGASPVVAEAAKALGALVVAVITKPFTCEGGRRKRNAECGTEELKRHVDSMIVIPNDRISLVAEKGAPLLKSFSIANDILRQAVQGISDMIMLPGLINLDFADVRTVMESTGRAVMGMGSAKGETGAQEAARKAISNPLLENSSIEDASGILINITGGLELALDDVQEASALISDNAHEDANIILGAVLDSDLKDEVRVTVIATGFKEAKKPAPAIEIPKLRKWSSSAPRMPELRGSDRVLAKSLNEGAYDDPLDIPTFIRKAKGAAKDAAPMPQQI